jgi:hypothetical protein
LPEKEPGTNTLAYFSTTFVTKKKSFVTLTPRPNAIKLFTAVIYHHSMVILTFCVVKAMLPGELPWNGSKLQWYFNPRKSRVKIFAIIYWGIVLKHWHQGTLL